MRLLLDTNTALSGLFSVDGLAGQLLQLWRSSYFEWISCSAQMLEMAQVLRRPKIVTRIAGGTTSCEKFMKEMHASCSFYPVQAPYPAICRDPDDDFLIALLVQSKADYLISGDKDVLALQTTYPNILTAREFLSRL